jgi:hypothetical protein
MRKLLIALALCICAAVALTPIDAAAEPAPETPAAAVPVEYSPSVLPETGLGHNCNYCLVILHGSFSNISEIRVTEDNSLNCEDSSHFGLPRGESTVSWLNIHDAGCFYLTSVHDAKVKVAATGQVTWVCSTGWKRLAEPPDPSEWYTKQVEIYANNPSHCG